MKAILRVSCVAGVFLLTACDDGGSTQAPAPAQVSSSQPTVSQQQTVTGKDASSYALRGADNSWPSVAKQQIVVSPQILARNYYLVVDTSGSMNSSECSGGKRKLDVAKQALSQFVNKLPPDANIGLLVFDYGKAKEIVAIGPNKQAAVGNAIQGIRQASGGTPLGSAVSIGYQALTGQARSQLGYGEYHLVVVTDGYADIGNKPDDIVASMLADSAVNLHTIGFCIDENHALNLPGQTIYKSAGNPKALMEGLDAVLAEAPDFQVAGFGE